MLCLLTPSLFCPDIFPLKLFNASAFYEQLHPWMVLVCFSLNLSKLWFGWLSSVWCPRKPSRPLVAKIHVVRRVNQVTESIFWICTDFSWVALPLCTEHFSANSQAGPCYVVQVGLLYFTSVDPTEVLPALVALRDRTTQQDMPLGAYLLQAFREGIVYQRVRLLLPILGRRT